MENFLSSLTLSAPCVIIGYITWDVNKWCESNACVRRSRRLHACVRECVLGSEVAGCWLVSGSCHLLKWAKVKVCNKLSLWLMTDHNSWGLSPNVVSSARWNIKATSYVFFVKWMMWFKWPHCFSPVPPFCVHCVYSCLGLCSLLRDDTCVCIWELTISSKLTLAPLLMSSCTISRLPCSAATMRGVCPFWNKETQSTGGWLSNTNEIRRHWNKMTDRSNDFMTSCTVTQLITVPYKSTRCLIFSTLRERSGIVSIFLCQQIHVKPKITKSALLGYQTVCRCTILFL